MIRIYFDPGKLTDDVADWWRAWQKKTSKGRDEVIQAWVTARSKARQWHGSDKDAPPEIPKPKVDAEIYRAFKRKILEELFHGKCGYCESFMGQKEDRVMIPDTEHFRPVRLVTVVNNGKTETIHVVYEDGVNREHPGYFWLAYDWQNLVPACDGCNKSPAKANHFPVGGDHVFLRQANQRPGVDRGFDCIDGYYLPDIEELNHLEEPLLLNPFTDDPEEHLTFSEFGIIESKGGSEKGQTTIHYLNLERLTERRKRIQFDFAYRYRSNFTNFHREEEQSIEEAHGSVVEKLSCDLEKAEYRAAILGYLDELYKGFRISDRFHEIWNKAQNARS
ncbi:MAG: hypothetical protein QNK37_08770 [Acidobacteriota bacterium]|nr:hypothetical protein [Acidobacteriota bacterium]